MRNSGSKPFQKRRPLQTHKEVRLREVIERQIGFVRVATIALRKAHGGFLHLREKYPPKNLRRVCKAATMWAYVTLMVGVVSHRQMPPLQIYPQLYPEFLRFHQREI
jgi:hypothetical protein